MKFKKTLALIAVTAAAAMSLAGCQSSGDGPEVEAKPSFAPGSTMERLSQADKIVIGTKFDQPLFGLKGPNGVPEGFDVEIGKIIAGKLGIPADKIEWKETVSQNREPFIQNGQVDLVIATYTINDKRKKVIDFAGPYYEAGQALLVAKGNPAGIKNVDDLKSGKFKVCTVTGSTSEKNIREYTNNIITTDKYSSCLEPIRSGAAQAMTTDNVILAGLVDQNGDEFEVLPGTFTQEPYGIGLKKGDTEFRNFVNGVLEESYKDGSWKKAWEETAGKVLPTPNPPAIEKN